MDNKRVKKENLAREEYNKIYLQYERTTQTPLRRFVFDYSLKEYLGDLKGKRVLDLACGSGYSTDMILKSGAKEVVGIDISDKQIDLARSRYSGNNSVKFFVKDATNNLSILGKFDVVVAMWLLHYSPTKEYMKQILQNVRQVIEPDGFFINAINNPKTNFNYNDYGTKISSDSKREGGKVLVTLGDFKGNDYCSFTIYHWTKKTQEKIFSSCGFNFEWLNCLISNDGLSLYGNEFWKGFLEKPSTLFVKLTPK